MSASELARELEVSPRTILRDIEALSSAGIPVYAVRGRQGGFELLDGFKGELPATWYRPDRRPAGAVVQRARIRLSPRGRRLAALLGRPAGLRIRRSTRPNGSGLAAAGAGRDLAGRRSRPDGDRADRRDWVEAWVRIESADAMVLDLLALGAEVEVVQPAELRARVAETARRIADLNDEPPGHDDPDGHAPGGTSGNA